MRLQTKDYLYLGSIAVLGVMLYRARTKNKKCDYLIQSLSDGYTFEHPTIGLINPRIKL